MSLARRLFAYGLAPLALLLGWSGAVFAQTAQDHSYRDGLETGKKLRDGAQSGTEQPVSPDQFPGYQDAPAELTNIYDPLDDSALVAGGNAAAASEPYSVMRQGDTNRSRVPVHATDDIKARGEEINADPAAYALGIDASGEQGKCEAITRPGATHYYEASCNVGSGVAASHPSCQIALDHHFSPGYKYSCSDVKLQGTLCINAYGLGCIPINYTASSGCGTFAAAGCPATASGSNIFYTYGGLNYSENSFSYNCPTAVTYSVTGSPVTVNGGTYMATASGPAGNGAYINSTQNLSMCADNQLTGCPSGSTLEGSQCVTRVAATVTLVCESGWTLNGTQCVQTISQPAAITGFNCPAGYTLEGDVCVSRVPATPVYSCDPDWTLEGTSCTRPTSHPATGEWSCPTGWTLTGTRCYQVQTVPATPLARCPIGWTLDGTNCTRQTSHPAAGIYSCPAGWTLSGTTCSQPSTVPATPNYSCLIGWTLAGTNCTLDEVVPATGTPQCNAGTTFDGSRCVLNWSFAATPSYSCPGGYALSGTTCTAGGNYAATPTYECFSIGNVGNGLCITGGVGGTCPAVPGLGSGSPTIIAGPFGPITLCYYNAVTTYSCPSGGTLEGTTCVAAASQPANVSFSCPVGTLSGNQCVGQTFEAPIGVGYTCPSGWTLSGSNCLRSSSQAATLGYACDPGFTLSGTSCTGTATQPATIGYACAPGETLSGTECIIAETQPIIVTYACEPGFNLSGTMCTGAVTNPATFATVCSGGETLVGTDCMGVETAVAAVNYSCESGTLEGNQCEMTATPTPAGLDCPEGFNLSQPGFCSKATSVPAGANYQCPAGMAFNGTECVSFTNPVSNPSAECTVESEVCSDASPQTRVIEGVAITQSCWAWTRTYSCTRVTTGNNDCQDFANNPQCTYLRDNCLDDPPNAAGGCSVAERVYSCPVPSESGTPQTELLCGGDIYCVNGVCEQVEREASSEMKDALVGLGAMDQAEKEFDPNNLSLFKGTRETCHKPVFGLVNCCAGKVSGLLSTGAGAAALAGGPAVLSAVATQFLTVFLCSTAEKQLDVKDRMGLCHYLGSYCSSKFLGICKTSRKAYCCFQSKLTRILQEQGRPQISKPWGPPKTEQCAGFTADEFSRLDLSVMDFSEIYNEFLEKAKLPAEAELAGEIQAKIRAYYATHGAN